MNCLLASCFRYPIEQLSNFCCVCPANNFSREKLRNNIYNYWKPYCKQDTSLRSFSLPPSFVPLTMSTDGQFDSALYKHYPLPTISHFVQNTNQRPATCSAGFPPPTHLPTSPASAPSRPTSQKNSSPASTSRLKYAAAGKAAGIICSVTIIVTGIAGGVRGVMNSSLRLRGRRKGLSRVRG